MRLTLIYFLLCFAIGSHAQQIILYKTFGGVRFERDSLIISIKQVHSLLEEEPEAYQQFKKARTNASVASVLGFAGGLLIGIPVGTAIAGGDPEWGMALSGAALIGISIPFNKAFQRHAESALSIYNQKHAARIEPKTELFLAGNGLGLRLRF